MKQTKNKYLRRLVRNYEIELNRPKGLKFLDQIIKVIPCNLTVSLFVSPTIHNECDRITRYKGYNVVRTSGLHRTQVCATDPYNLLQ